MAVGFYCVACDDFRDVQIEELKRDALNKGKLPWGDIVCVECHLVIATINANEPGKYEFERVETGEYIHC